MKNFQARNEVRVTETVTVETDLLFVKPSIGLGATDPNAAYLRQGREFSVKGRVRITRLKSSPGWYSFRLRGLPPLYAKGTDPAISGYYGAGTVAGVFNYVRHAATVSQD